MSSTDLTVTARASALATKRHLSGGLILSPDNGGDWVLADTSGSMACETPTPGMNRIECVRQALAPMRRQVRVIAFGAPRYATHSEFDTRACEVPADEIPSACGGTPMHDAFTLLIPRHPDHTLVMSDGEVERDELTLELARKCSGIIDAMYIGPDDPRAEQFMRELARIGHGRFMRFDLSQKAIGFSQAVQMLLPAPAQGVIAL